MSKNCTGLVLMLDIDGVLTCDRVANARREDTLKTFDPIAGEAIGRLCNQFDVRVVITSSWRIGRGRDRSYFFDLFSAAGFNGIADNLHSADALTRTDMGLDVTRGHEIAEWLERNGNPRFLILDDEEDFHKDQLPFLVKTSISNGMLNEHFLMARSKLRAARDEIEKSKPEIECF